MISRIAFTIALGALFLPNCASARETSPVPEDSVADTLFAACKDANTKMAETDLAKQEYYAIQGVGARLRFRINMPGTQESMFDKIANMDQTIGILKRDDPKVQGEYLRNMILEKNDLLAQYERLADAEIAKDPGLAAIGVGNVKALDARELEARTRWDQLVHETVDAAIERDQACDRYQRAISGQTAARDRFTTFRLRIRSQIEVEIVSIVEVEIAPYLGGGAFGESESFRLIAGGKSVGFPFVKNPRLPVPGEESKEISLGTGGTGDWEIFDVPLPMKLEDFHGLAGGIMSGPSITAGPTLFGGNAMLGFSTPGGTVNIPVMTGRGVSLSLFGVFGGKWF